jgi:ABC-type transporter Mla subunit MlaD
MATQDLTPQIRTRLNRMERYVGLFVLLAAMLMVAGFCYYLYNQAQRRGWFEVRAHYFTYAETGEGVVAGDPVKLMGFEVGRITRVFAMPARGTNAEHNVEIDFEVVGDNYKYIWTNSMATLKDSGFLGKREIDISKGTGTNVYTVYAVYPFKQRSLEEITNSDHFDKLRFAEELSDGTNVVIRPWWLIKTNMANILALGINNIWAFDTTRPTKKITAIWDQDHHRYLAFSETNMYMLSPDEPPALMQRAQALVSQVEVALPNFLKITNRIDAILSNSEQLTSNLNIIAENVRPTVANLATITDHLKDPHGSLGEWLIPTNLNEQLGLTLLNANGALTNVNGTVTNVNTNLTALFEQVSRSLDNLASITSNLNNQVQVNSNMLTQISEIVVHSDQFVQGLKHHWLLRSAFKERKPKTKNPP